MSFSFPINRTLVLVCSGIFFYMPFLALGAVSGDVVISEVAWMGTKASSADEWVELRNATASAIDLNGWGLYASGGSTNVIVLTHTISAGGYYLIERSDDTAIPDVTADEAGPFGGSGLSNSGEYLVLKDAAGNVIDQIDFASGWPAGVASPEYQAMERDTAGWHTNDGSTRTGTDVKGNPINGTPRAQNSAVSVSSNGAGGTQGSVGSSSPSSGVSSQSAVIADAGNNVAVRAGDEVSFDASASQGSALTFTWNLGDGVVASGERVAHYYPFAGTYIVTLTATDGRTAHGEQIEVRVYPINIFISEFLPVPREGKKGWVELYNGADHVTDLSGWGIGASKNAAELTLPENTFLAAHGFLVLPEDMLGFTLPAQGELSLWYPHGQAARRIVYQAPAQGFSIALNGNDQFVATASVTPGARNVLTASGYAATPSLVSTASANKKENAALEILSQETKVAPLEDITPPAVVVGSFNASTEGETQRGADTALTSRAFGYNIYFLIAGALGFLMWIALRRRPAPVTEEEGAQ